MKSKRLVCPEHGVIRMEELELPDRLEGNQMLVRHTHGAEKHGTMESFVHKHGNSRGAFDNERKLHTGTGMNWAYPIPLGNMQVGHIEAVGPDCGDFRTGERIAHFAGFSDLAIACAPNAWKLDASTAWQSATCLDPAKYALGALRDGNVRLGDSVAIFSLGAIGLCAVILAKLAGCHPVVAIDPVAKRRQLAEALGADITLDPTEGDTGKSLRELTRWRGVDVIIEYSGAAAALNASIRGVAFGGNIVCGAFPSPYPAGVDFGGEAHMNRPNIIFSRADSDPNRNHPNWNAQRLESTAKHLILEGRIDGTRIIDPVVPFSDDLDRVYQNTMADKEHAIKMGVAYS